MFHVRYLCLACGRRTGGASRWLPARNRGLRCEGCGRGAVKVTYYGGPGFPEDFTDDGGPMPEFAFRVEWTDDPGAVPPVVRLPLSLKEDIDAVVQYNLADEAEDAIEQAENGDGVEGHVLHRLVRLNNFAHGTAKTTEQVMREHGHYPESDDPAEAALRFKVQKCRGVFAEGYTSADVDTVFEVLAEWTGLNLVCLWERYDYGRGVSGGSTFYAVDVLALREVPAALTIFLLTEEGEDNAADVSSLRELQPGKVVWAIPGVRIGKRNYATVAQL